MTESKDNLPVDEACEPKEGSPQGQAETVHKKVRSTLQQKLTSAPRSTPDNGLRAVRETQAAFYRERHWR